MGTIHTNCANCKELIRICTTGEEYEWLEQEETSQGTIYFCSSECKENFYEALGDE